VKEDYLPDMDDTIESFQMSADYLQRRKMINIQVSSFRARLPRELQADFNDLMDAVLDDGNTNQEKLFQYLLNLFREPSGSAG